MIHSAPLSAGRGGRMQDRLHHCHSLCGRPPAGGRRSACCRACCTRACAVCRPAPGQHPAAWFASRCSALPTPVSAAAHPLTRPPLPILRSQFGDRPILSYLTHQRRLFVGLATTYGEGDLGYDCLVLARPGMGGVYAWSASPLRASCAPWPLPLLDHRPRHSLSLFHPAALHLAMLQLKQVVLKVRPSCCKRALGTCGLLRTCNLASLPTHLVEARPQQDSKTNP